MDTWEKFLESGTLSSLPTDYISPADGRVVQATHTAQLPETVRTSFARLAKHFSSSETQIGIALWLILVHRYTGDEDVIVGSLTDKGQHSIIRTFFKPETGFAQLLEDVKKSEEIAAASPKSHSEIRQATGREFFRTQYSGRCITDEIGEKDIMIVQTAAQLSVGYNTLLYKKKRIEFLVEQIFVLVEAIAADPKVNVLTISLVSEPMKEVLPDPTLNLDWGNFRGPIQDIFSANAAKFPDRPCVTETGNTLRDPAAKNRVFTYGELDAASNALGNKLKGDGIEVDDVVMIYAYRGVDLVVAVMGVLKAGATFSVIDPAYPPERQNIYLSVAKPRGLVVLAKAGAIHGDVRKYVDTELSLKSEVLDLEIKEGGSLSSAHDTLSGISTAPVGVEVGPDNHPTLSFTSGSEGVPKGVRGRHFSLTYYFPWMATTYGLSEKDRFTMLSGIAHDPIQRDIFTPLFLGAQLIVPTADDIGTPGRLAEWMALNKTTVTHLTPAMGQLLSALATANIPDLRNAFFVGDILTKRDCLKLQALAPNVSIINMYGTTETQRAVSYFALPSVSQDRSFLSTQKDTIPAGKGMLNVQMLVVNRNDRTKICGVGEVGEIYVRAGGLSDGYLSLPDMTATKFITNWFPAKFTKENEYHGPGLWLGPRDRLYRTGDLGRYLPDGNCECSGRADDQVKIRGFRIELGEINTHISRHKAVRENITLVRRNKDEEPVLVAYVVPESNAVQDGASETTAKDPLVNRLVKYRSVIRDIRDYLKTKLPSYAVPSLIVPMNKLPLNPNGKIDKPRLPFPDTAQLELAAQQGSSSTDSLTATESAVKSLWLEILPTRPATLDRDDSFFDVGGHSILATRLVFEARTKFALPDLPLGSVFSQPTLSGFSSVIDSALSDGIESTPAPEASTGKIEAKYGEDAESLVKKLPSFSHHTYRPFSKQHPITVFLTGASGFLGAFVLKDLLQRPYVKVVAHVRARDAEHGLERLKATASAYGTWQEAANDRLRVVTGSLEQPLLGLDQKEWDTLAAEVDVIIHNGALVHWVYPYSTLRGPNVLGTLSVIELCSQGKAKTLNFVSSTSVLDAPHYFRLSEHLTEQGKQGIPESDDLEGSRVGLGTGYGQSKWVAEHIIRAAGKKGLQGTIVRPGYIVGDSTTGVSNTDDFLIRMLKGCQELEEYPSIANGVNMVPVDHVARVTVSAALHPPSQGVAVVHVTAHPRITFSEMLGSLGEFGYNTRETEYINWRGQLEKYVVSKGESALFPLLHFVLDNLPYNTQAPELDDSNACEVLKADASWTGVDLSEGSGVDTKQLGIYISFLVACGFLPSPPRPGNLPQTVVSADVLKHFSSAGGRSK